MPRCLIVDDDLDSREGYSEYLRANGYVVDTLEDAREALGTIRQHRPDVVLLDLQMPHIDGWELLRQLRADPPIADVPVVVVSACVFPDDRARAAEAGCNMFLTKPCLPDEVLSSVQSVLAMSNLRK